MRTRAMLGAAALGGLACGARGEKAVALADSLPPAPADSLVATAPGGTEVWFTLARPDSGEGGRCTDRAIEIRRGGTRIPVPLLYTGAAPEVVNDTTLRASLSTGCRPGDIYLVNLRTGHPVRERR
jgi:hypothetical protein